MQTVVDPLEVFKSSRGLTPTELLWSARFLCSGRRCFSCLTLFGRHLGPRARSVGKGERRRELRVRACKKKVGPNSTALERGGMYKVRTNVKYVNMAALWWRWCPRYAPFRARLRILGVMRPRLRPASVRRTYLGSVSFFFRRCSSQLRVY